MENNENFEFCGFPKNEEIEIPDPVIPKKSSSKNGFFSQLSEMSVDELMKLLPPEAIEEIEAMANMTGMSLEQLLENSINVSKSFSSGDPDEIFKSLGFNIQFHGGEGLDECADCEDGDCDTCEYFKNSHDRNGSSGNSEPEKERKYYALCDLKYLKPEYFGSVECVEDSDLYNKFIEKYGRDSTKYLDPNVGVKESYLTDLTSQLPLANVKNLRFVEATDKFILFYAETDIENTFGFFVSIVETPDGKFALYIPEFRNTFDVIDDETVVLYNPVKDSHIFVIDSNGTGEFKELSIPMIELAINFALAPVKRVLLSPLEFGTIKSIMPPVTGSSQWLQIGLITSNETPEAILLKKDAELDLEKNTFPLYFKFNTTLGKDVLQELAGIFFRTDFNKCPFLNYAELQYTNDHRLYIDVDLGEV